VAGGTGWVGLAVETHDAPGRRLSEVVLDGQLADPVDCGAAAPANIVLWDVTDPASPMRAGALAATTSDRNARSWILAGLPLRRGASYRLVARVTSRRASPLAAPWEQDGLVVTGGLSFADDAPCSGAAAAAAGLDRTATALAVRVTRDPETHWTAIAGGVTGAFGKPRLFGKGVPTPQTVLSLTLAGLAPHGRSWLVAGASPLVAPLYGGTLVPRPDVVLALPPAGDDGSVTVSGRWPPETPDGFTVWLQGWVPEGGGAWSASDGLAVTSPF